MTESRQDEQSAETREPYLLPTMAVSGVTRVLCLRTPFGSRHPGAADRLANILGGDRRGIFQHRHAAVQNIESKLILTAHEWSNLAAQYRHFVSAIEALDFERVASARRRSGGISLRGTRVFRAATCRFHLTAI